MLSKIVRALKKSKRFRNWKYIVIHHSATVDNPQTDNWEAIRRWHTGENPQSPLNWRDIGYHLGFEYVNGKPEVRYGRSLSVSGAHASVKGNRYFNEKGIGFCIIGNFEVQHPPQSLLKLAQLMAMQYQFLFDIPRQNVIGHNEATALLNKGVPLTACPGTFLDMDDFRNNVKGDSICY